MNKLPMVAAVVAAIAALAVLGIFLSRRQTTSTSSTGSMMLDEIENETNAPESLRELMSLAANQTCTFQDDDGNEGTVYVGGGKMRGDFTSTTEEETLGTHMISDSTNIYMWFDGATDGFKMALAEQEELTDFGEDLPAQAGGQKSVDLDKPVDFNCNPWVVDNSKFETPDIEFQDFSSLMQELPNTIEEGEEETSSDAKAMQCEACDNLPEDSQAQCRQLLGC